VCLISATKKKKVLEHGHLANMTTVQNGSEKGKNQRPFKISHLSLTNQLKRKLLTLPSNVKLGKNVLPAAL
jgi:hypothetical protein